MAEEVTERVEANATEPEVEPEELEEEVSGDPTATDMPTEAETPSVPVGEDRMATPEEIAQMEDDKRLSPEDREPLNKFAKYQDEKEQLFGWLGEWFDRFNNRQGLYWQKHISRESYEAPQPEKGKGQSARLSLHLYLGEHSYHISMHTYEDRESYLGMTSSTTKYIVGENWNRGSDHADGKFSKELFERMIKDILRMELRKIETHDGRVAARG